MSNSAPRTKLYLGIVACVLCLALGWKTVRYTQPEARMTTTFDQRLTQFLGDQNWVRQKVAGPDAQNKAVQIITFTKSTCATPLRISIVGTTSGLESYLRQKFGDDLAFVQHGRVLKHPSLLRYQVVTAWTTLMARLAGTPPIKQPIVAVTPAPSKGIKPCGGPTRDQWMSF